MVNFFERRPTAGVAKDVPTLQGRELARPFDVVWSEAMTYLVEGSEWLVDNERGRHPV